MKLHLPHFLRAAVLACLVTVSSTIAHAAENGTLHLFVLTGQSNSMGSVKGSPATAEQLDQYASEGLFWNGTMKQDGSVWYLSAETGSDPTWGAVAPYTCSGYNCMGPEYGFSYMMLHKGWVNTEAGDGLGIIKASLDGGGNNLWVKGQGAYNRILLTVKTALGQMKESDSYSKIQLEGLMYLQGESNDAAGAAAAATRYQQFLSDLKADLTADGYDVSLLADSVLGEPATWTDTTKTARSTTTATNLKALADAKEDIGWVRTRDLTKITSGDTMGVHYDGKSQITIGARYAYAMALQQEINVGAVRNDDYTGVSLNEAGAWWNGAVPTASDVITWDVSSANVADTLSGDLAVQGIVVEDPFRSEIAITTASGAASAPTLSIGSSGIELQKGGLSIRTNVTTTADQSWRVSGGQKLTIGNSDAAVVLGGSHTVSLNRLDSEGTATYELHASGSSGAAARTWKVGDGVDFFLSSTGDTVEVADNAAVSLGAAGSGSLELASLVLGDNATLAVGGAGTVGGFSVNSLTLGSGCTLGMDILRNDSYDSLSLSSMTGSSVTFDFTYGLALSANRSYTVVQGWDDSINYTYNADAGYNRTAVLSVVDGNLVLSLVEEKPDYTQSWVAAEGEAQTITSATYNATASASSTLTVGKTVTGNTLFYANNVSQSVGDFYAELQNANLTCLAAFGQNSSSARNTMTGNAHAKVSGTETNSITTAYGVVNGTVHAQEGVEGSGSIYVELDNPNARYNDVYGIYNASVDGSVSLIINGTVTRYVVAGAMGSGTQSIGGGTYLQITGGTFGSLVLGGSAVAATIDNGAHIYIKDGTFNGAVYGGNNNANAIINGGTELYIDGGTFNTLVSAGNNGSGTINGGTRLTINGGVFKGYVLAGGGGSGTGVNGGTELIISGGDFSALDNQYGIYAGGGSSSLTIEGGSTTILKGIDESNTFASYTGILSGGSLVGTLNGAKKLELMGYTAGHLQHQLRSFDEISVTGGSVTSISDTQTLGGATALDISLESTLTLEAGNEWDLGTTHATVETGSSLSKGGAAQLTLASIAGEGEFRAQEGTAVLNSVAGFSGTVKVVEAATANAVAGSSEAVTYDVDKGGTAQITAAGGNLGTLTGSGLVEMTGTGGDTSTAFSMEEGVWTGTVKFNAGRTNMASLDMSLYGVKGSTIAFQGAGTAAKANASYINAGSIIESDFLLEADANGIGLKLTAGASDNQNGAETAKHITFKGAWSGDGDFQFVTGPNYNIKQHFVFVNDLSGYEGDLIADCAATFHFGNGAFASAVGSVTGKGTVSGTGSGADHTVKVIINYTDSSHSENSFTGNLQITKEGSSAHTFEAENSYTGATIINGGTLALKEEGTLGTGNITLANAAARLAIGDSTTLAAQSGSASGSISGHSKVSASGIEGTEAARASVSNISLTTGSAALTEEEMVVVKYVDFSNMDLLAGQYASMTLSHVSFDTSSSAQRMEGVTQSAITASHTAITLSAAEFSAPPALATLAEGDSSSLTETLTIVSTRFNALSFTDSLTLTDTENYINSLFADNPGVGKVVMSFDGADLEGVSQVVYNGALPADIIAARVGNAIVFSTEENLPEPATTTLSLLALAALLSRRRRRAI